MKTNIDVKILRQQRCYEGRIIAQLKLKQSCYKGIEYVTVKEICRTPAHKVLVKEANEQIEKNRIRYTTAYNELNIYLNN